MTHFKYSYGAEKGVQHAKSQMHDVNASFKDLGAVCDAIRRKDAGYAVELLEAVSKQERPIEYRRHNKRMGHRRELGGKKGRYPKKAAKLVLRALRNAIANASFKGMGDSLLVKHCCANKQRIFPRLAPRGTSRRANYETARIEIVLEESPEETRKLKARKEKAAEHIRKGPEAKKEQAVEQEAKRIQEEVKRAVAEKAKQKGDAESVKQASGAEKQEARKPNAKEAGEKKPEAKDEGKPQPKADEKGKKPGENGAEQGKDTKAGEEKQAKEGKKDGAQADSKEEKK